MGTSTWRKLWRSDGFGLEAEMTARVLPSGHRIYWMPIGYRAGKRFQGKKIR